MSPVAINGVDKQGVYVNGVQVKQALSADSETVNKGIYLPTTLSAVDADLAVGNIKLGVTIFGFVGTLPAGGVETIELYSNNTIVNGATYTPGDSGIFYNSSDSQTQAFSCEYFSTGAGLWYKVGGTINEICAFTAIGDGTNFRIRNNSGGNREYIMYRHFITTWTYERARDEDLGGGANWTPTVSGFFADASEIGDDPRPQANFGAAGWSKHFAERQTPDSPATIWIGDGTNMRIANTTGGALYHVAMRALMS